MLWGLAQKPASFARDACVCYSVSRWSMIVSQVPSIPRTHLRCNALCTSSSSKPACESALVVLHAQANEQLQVVRESHAATSKEVADAHR